MTDMKLDEARLLHIIRTWEPPADAQRQATCSNCLNARVSGSPARPEVRCAAGYAAKGPAPLVRLIRSHHPVGFRPAAQCPGYTDMGPPCNTEKP